eukprot:TRINITY_DN39305_c0_g1_i4.p1 TRINITY_DN39305_c0_g1~~TRINITY_DN39305_c0_g1_i4.p1  ORF type:complete len:165 (+),score=35.11 TRINITY_DN39305_c0_g1_i4:232-726(+)
MWYCGNCKEHKQATKKFDVWRGAKCLIIHLVRFSQLRYGNTDFGRLERLDTVVDVPSELDIQPWLKEDSENVETVYELYGVSNHMGGMGGGHYTALCKTGPGSVADREWYNFDDSRVSQCGSDSAPVNGRSAYVLFYLRRDLAQSDQVGVQQGMRSAEGATSET